jgi:hypothetical protein
MRAIDRRRCPRAALVLTCPLVGSLLAQDGRPDLWVESYVPRTDEVAPRRIVAGAVHIPAGVTVFSEVGVDIVSEEAIVIEGAIVASGATPQPKDGASIDLRSARAIIVLGTIEPGNGRDATLRGRQAATAAVSG